jgi:hypothetical protein
MKIQDLLGYILKINVVIVEKQCDRVCNAKVFGMFAAMRHMTTLTYGSETDSHLSDKSSYCTKNGKNKCEFDFRISKIFQDNQY